MKRIYKLLVDAGIWTAFTNLYSLDGVFDCHRDRFLFLSSNCMPEVDATKVKITDGTATRRLQARFRSRCARAISSCASSSPGATAWA
jgi:hypothetical protein